MTKTDLIEDYERRLENINRMIDVLKDEEQTDTVKKTLERYRTKRGCYRTFIAEIKNLEDE
jgi:hypothetical protein